MPRYNHLLTYRIDLFSKNSLGMLGISPNISCELPFFLATIFTSQVVTPHTMFLPWSWSTALQLGHFCICHLVECWWDFKNFSLVSLSKKRALSTQRFNILVLQPCVSHARNLSPSSRIIWEQLGHNFRILYLFYVG